MVPSTAPGLFILLVVVLPGSVYTWAYERQTSAYGVTLADRFLRFVAVSVIFQLLLAWPEYGVYRLAVIRHHHVLSGEFAVLSAGAVLLVALPAVVGTVLGGLYATRTARVGWPWIRAHVSASTEARILRVALGRTPAPRAWDNLFSERPNVYLRIRLATDKWIAGRFAEASYAGGFPNDADLLLEEAWAVDPDTGDLGNTGLGFPLYIPAATIDWIEVIAEQLVEEGHAHA